MPWIKYILCNSWIECNANGSLLGLLIAEIYYKYKIYYFCYWVSGIIVFNSLGSQCSAVKPSAVQCLALQCNAI